MKEWRNETPPEFEINLDLLKGHYLIEYQDSTTATIRHFPKSCLPPSAKERLEHLFQIRRKWVREDLLPYVDDLAEDDKKLELLLLKFGRTSREAGVTYYSRRA
ncbi:hypothetical protein DFJ73DRAFT_349558 [Zopfochytrium polystomum]|nr:hypothetical protein DFJ73DRAFT_349558 [Zopfochytrium polystomum]